MCVKDEDLAFSHPVTCTLKGRCPLCSCMSRAGAPGRSLGYWVLGALIVSPKTRLTSGGLRRKSLRAGWGPNSTRKWSTLI